MEGQSQACGLLFCLVSWGKFACDFPNFVSSFLADIYSLLIQQMCQALFNALLSIIYYNSGNYYPHLIDKETND